jgi:hypothetical protein
MDTGALLPPMITTRASSIACSAAIISSEQCMKHHSSDVHLSGHRSTKVEVATVSHAETR